MSGTPFSVAVYCGSRNGARPAYRDLALRLGTAIGRRGWQLVYGGGRAGLMGAVADATLAAGGTVVGVIPESLMNLEVGHAGLTELHVVQTMHQRKQMMAERSHAFIAMPGGIGTFEELFEVWTWRHLAYHDRPIGLLDVEGYWAPMLKFLHHSVAEGFMGDDQMAMLHTDDQVERLLDTLAARAGDPTDDNFSQI
ncbi:LOG family protein [Pseudaquabacterium pictum]|uniref:Cytokinin riboside 5'-monophosphate phosphoribohydrolase n=1 Tax=Pseudaquabacterium pictum TaxID=2315236 RepID=A0A480ANC2_9BURK|nr:TIGR00730 family Rossman fold protein [Rubrivivax pictus]GCL61552.1 putative cytokinin riboside 5'-monophosphate phosphoribohydrolase [Rubrivivax pictus]